VYVFCSDRWLVVLLLDLRNGKSPSGDGGSRIAGAFS
jgi:hypothetical protein